MSDVVVEKFSDAGQLVDAAAARLVTTIVDAQKARGFASIVLTGGGTGIALLEKLREAPGDIDWSQIDLYWGDERFLPSGDPERNEVQAREALLDHVPVDPDRVHAMAASDGIYDGDPHGGGDGVRTTAGRSGTRESGSDVRRAPARYGRRRTRQLVVPAHRRCSRRSAFRSRGDGLPPQAATGADHPHVACCSASQRGLAARLGCCKGRGRCQSRRRCFGRGLAVRRRTGLVATRWFLDTDAASQLP